jgi:hypothetical protein
MAYVLNTPPAAQFGPADVPGLVLWLDATDPNGDSSELAANSTMTTWYDKSGQANHFTASGTVTYNATGTKGVQMNGTFMSNASFTNLPTGVDADYSILIACVITDLTTDRSLVSYGATPTNYVSLYCTTAGLLTWAGPGAGSVTYGTYVANTALILTDVILTRGFNALRYYGRILPGTIPDAHSTTSAGPTTGITMNSSPVYLGASVNSIPAIQGRVYEVLMYNGGIGLIQVTALQSYLRRKYVNWDPAFSISNLNARFHPFATLSPVLSRPSIPYDQRGMWYNSSAQGPSSIMLWLDAADSSTITTTAGKVTQWRDKSGWANHLSPVGIYSNAAVQTAYQNGLNVLNFTGSNMYASANSAAVYPYECFAVVALKSLVRTDIISVGSTSSDNYNSLTFSEFTALRWQNGSTTNSRTPNTVTSADETSTSFLILGWSIGGSNFCLYRNGALLTRTRSYTFTLTAASRIQVGARRTNTSVPDIQCNMYLAEIMMFNNQLNNNERRQLEYYLADKWGLLSQLTWPCIVRPARNPVFNPKSMRVGGNSGSGPSLTLWLDAADAATVEIRDGKVRSWADKALYNGVEFVFFQNTVSSQPSYVNNGIVFDTVTNASLTSSIPASTILPLTDFTVFVVAKNCIGLSAYPTSYIFGISNGSTNYLGWAIGPSTNQVVGGVAYPLPGDFFFTARRIATINTYFSLNGGTPLTSTGGTNPGGGTNTMMIGRGNRRISGSVHEIIVFNGGLNTTQMQLIEGYLAWKWNLVHKLPSTHPYYKYYPSP